jgi:RNA recognition motif-containing protein
MKGSLMRLYIGNMSYDMTEDDVRQMLSAHGEVASVDLITDRDTGRPKGFGFADMPNDAEAQAAISALNETEVQGRTIKVNQARPREERGGGRF